MTDTTLAEKLHATLWDNLGDAREEHEQLADTFLYTRETDVPRLRALDAEMALRILLHQQRTGKPVDVERFADIACRHASPLRGGPTVKDHLTVRQNGTPEEVTP